MHSDPILIGLDVGTTNIKAVAFRPDGQIVGEAGLPTPTYYPQPGWACQDAEELWQATVKALRQLTARLAETGQASRIASIAVASVGEAAVPVDAQGQPLFDMIAWFDRRTQPQVNWLERTIGKDRLFAASGLSLQPIFGLCKLLWIKENQPDVFARTAQWLNTADYIAYRLCGVPATDYSLASRTLGLDLAQLQWNEALLKEVGLSPDIFAPLRPSGTRLETVTAAAAEATGLPAATQVAVGGHDHVCGALAVGVIEPGAMLNSLGTAEAVFIPLDKPLADPATGRQGYTQGAHVVAGHYYVLGGLYTSGACVEWWREIVGDDTDYAALIDEARQIPPGSLGAYFLPHLRLANPPHDDPKGRGAFIGLSSDVNRGAMFRAILEGLAYESRYTLDSLVAYAEVTAPRHIYAIGGGTRNDLLLQIKASILNQPLTVIEVAEATSLGAAILGGLGAGIYADVPSVLKTLTYRQTVAEPVAADITRYDTYFRQLYQRIYAALRPLHHTIYAWQGASDA